MCRLRSKILETLCRTQGLMPTRFLPLDVCDPGNPPGDVASVNKTTIPALDRLSVVVGNARRGRDQRLVSRCRVEFDRPSGPVDAETEDLSPHGLYIRTEALLPVGEETDLRLTLPDGSILALYARVAHMLTP